VVAAQRDNVRQAAKIHVLKVVPTNALKDAQEISYPNIDRVMETKLIGRADFSPLYYECLVVILSWD